MKPLNALFNDLGGQLGEINNTNMGDCMVANCNSDIGNPCQGNGSGNSGIDYLCMIQLICTYPRP